MPATAIDIGTYSIKAVSGKTGKSVNVVKTAESSNPLGVAAPTDDALSEKFVDLVTNFISDHKLPRSEIRLSLPESLVSTKVISIPNLSDAELASAIDWQAEQHIPIPKEELSLEYKVIYRPPKKDKKKPMRVLLVATRKTIIERYTDAFFELGVEPILLETHMLSIIRNLQFTNQEPTTLIVNLGASAMDTSIIHEGELLFIFSNQNGGQLLTKTLQQTIGLNASQAEEYKRNYGLDERHFEGKVRDALLPPVNTIVGEIKKSISYFSNQYPKQSAQRIVLNGGGSQLPGLVEHITQTLGIEVLLSSPFANAKGEIPDTNHLAYAVCMGLLMRKL